ncbi:hypothetical protein H4S08_002135 [Coemansia sp. RSA 1365]|nr:hypothetical protein H4S08_002135 [Coemansia sp. RSA 1365]
MSLLSPDQRVRVYRLGRAGHLKDSATGTPIKTSFNEATTRGETGFITPFRELAKDYLSGGSRIIAEHAVEVAIRSEAKRFTAQTLVGEVVYMLWDGTLHWKGFHCICLTSPNNTADTTQQCNSTLAFSFERRGSVESDSEACETTECGELDSIQNTSVSKSQIEDWLIKRLAPLRIPMVESALTMLHNFFFLTIYTVVSLRREEELSIEEVIMHVCALAYIADETRQCMENGVAVYLKSVWNVLDVTIYTVFTAFFCLRVRSLFTGSEADLDKAYDVLALNASMLWPRLFAVLDQFEFCGTIIIQVRRIIAGTSLFFALLLAMTMGFFQTFYALSRKHNELDAKNIWGLMTRIFFGSALLGWDQADLFGPYVGYLVMATYIGVSMLILYNILIGVINQCMMEIERNAAEEFRFAYTMRVAEYVNDIDEFAFSGSTNDTSDDESTDIGYNTFGHGETQHIGNEWNTSSVPVIPTDSSLRNLIVSPTLTIGTNASNSNSDSGITGRWVSLMNAWRSRNNHSKNLSPQSPRWSSTDALDTAANTNIQSADALNTIAEKEQHIQTTKKLAQLQTQVTEIDKKLTIIARLLQPVTDRD